MNAALGGAGVTLSLVACVAGIAVTGVGLGRGDRRWLLAGRRYVWLVLAGAVLATVAMEAALISHDFSIAFVADNNARDTPLLYTITGMWSALEGSILLWALVLAGYLAAMIWRFRHRATDPLVAWATLVALAVALFFFALMAGPADPFRLVSGAIPTDGTGPNPLLQNHPLVAFHPPMLYLGYVGFTVPFAFALAALVTGRLGESWLAETRRWALFAWAFLTAGIVLGGWWSYEVLGWGGYWAWDPVENASLLPWLTATAYLHSVMAQQRRGLLAVWNLSLLVATFALTILGTFLTRSGVLDSVHAFSESQVGPALLAFFAVSVAVAVGLVAWRGDRLRAPGSVESPISREGAFLANNVAFAGFTVVVLLGTVFPLLAEALNGERLSVGSPYFDRMTLPLGLTLLFLMAVAPALPWRRAGSEVMHQRLFGPALAATVVVVAAVVAGRRGVGPLLGFGLATFAAGSAVGQLARSARAARRGGHSATSALLGRSGGGMIVHLGVILIAFAFSAGSGDGERRQFRLAPGQSAEVEGHTITYLGFRTQDLPNRRATVARVRVDDGRVFEPALSQFPFATQAIGTPSVRTGVLADVYLTLVAVPEGPGGEAVIGVNVAPLVTWIWAGAGVMLMGTALAAWPRARRRSAAATALPVDEGTGLSASVDERTVDERTAEAPVPTVGAPADPHAGSAPVDPRPEAVPVGGPDR
ncbi:MAG: heme lyase CcmF/NrfE family subunit [Acidimicrobiales bacterium]